MSGHTVVRNARGAHLELSVGVLFVVIAGMPHGDIMDLCSADEMDGMFGVHCAVVIHGFERSGYHDDTASWSWSRVFFLVLPWS